MVRTIFQSNSVALVIALMLGIAPISLASQDDRIPSKELVQYIREAKRQGIEEAKIKEKAMTLGWSAADVDRAIQFEKSGKPLPAQAAPQPAQPGLASQALAPASDTMAAPGPTERLASDQADNAVNPPTVPRTPGVSDDYLIGPGDTLQISIWKEPEASVPSEVVRPDGKISVPLIKDVQVGGLTPREAEAIITQKIGKFITDPNVTVVVSSIRSKKIYLLGAVKKEGSLPYSGGITVMQALSEAGGLTDYAKRRKIYVLRTEAGRDYRLNFNYEEVVRGERMEQNVVLLPGDTVVVPQ